MESLPKLLRDEVGRKVRNPCKGCSLWGRCLHIVLLSGLLDPFFIPEGRRWITSLLGLIMDQKTTEALAKMLEHIVDRLESFQKVLDEEFSKMYAELGEKEKRSLESEIQQQFKLTFGVIVGELAVMFSKDWTKLEN